MDSVDRDILAMVAELDQKTAAVLDDPAVPDDVKKIVAELMGIFSSTAAIIREGVGEARSDGA